MKDLKFPTMSEEEEKKVWDNLKPNDKLVCIERSNWGGHYYIREHTILRRTPKGNIRLDNNELLKYLPSNYFPISEELKKCIKLIILEEKVMNLLYEANRAEEKFKLNLNYEDAIELKSILGRTINLIKD